MHPSRAPAECRGRRSIAALAVITQLVSNASCTARAPSRHGAAETGRDVLFEEARRAAQSDRLDDARQCYDTLLARDPLDDEARAGLARLDAWSGRYAQAERTYREILTRHPDDDDVRAGLFNVLVWTHAWDAAARLVHEAPRQNTPVILSLHARLEHARGDVTTARSLAERARSLAPKDPEIRALVDRFATRSSRVTAHALVFETGLPALGQVDLSLSQSLHRLRLTFETEQGGRPTSLSGGWVYGATYGLGGTWTFAPGLSLGTDAAFGAPAAMVPLLRVRAYGTLPIRPWLGAGLGYTFRHFAEGIDTHGVNPSLGLTLLGEVRLDVTYWLTHVRVSDGRSQGSSRLVQAIGVAVGRTFFPWLDLRAGYAHGAEAERMPAMFQLLDLVNDSFYVGARLMPLGFVWIEPLYGLALRGPANAARTVQHSFELGIVLRQ